MRCMAQRGLRLVCYFIARLPRMESDHSFIKIRIERPIGVFPTHFQLIILWNVCTVSWVFLVASRTSSRQTRCQSGSCLFQISNIYIRYLIIYIHVFHFILNFILFIFLFVVYFLIGRDLSL